MVIVSAYAKYDNTPGLIVPVPTTRGYSTPRPLLATFAYGSMIGIRMLMMGVIENETFGSSPCDRKSHNDGERENATFGSSPCDPKSHTDGESGKRDALLQT